MKKNAILCILGFLLLTASQCNAQTLIAVQNESSSSFYDNLDSAIVHAVSGDFIYIPGGSFPITVPINKKLQIVGVGHNPDSCAVTGISQIAGSINIINGSDHGSISGLKISGSVSFGTSPTEVSISYFSIERCNIGGSLILATQSSNILVNECIIQGLINGNNTMGFQLSKCIIEGKEFENPGVNGCVIQNFNSNAYFINNIFIGWKTSLWMVVNCHFRNNVFRSGPYNFGGNSLNLIQNNIFNGGETPGLYYIGQFINNIIGPLTDLFVNQSGYVYDYTQDYHIVATSPAHDAGTDGTDLGVYGTGSPWKEGSLPGNPHIQSKTFSKVNGNLNVEMKVAAQDY
ncbi:MAG: hypothetical protein ACOYMF_15745 [Bacteroidales bacterium]